MPDLVIRQIQAPRPGVPMREMRLSGRAGPQDKISRKVSQRAQLTWLPGSGTGSTRLDGGEEGEQEFTFNWEGRLVDPTEMLIGEVGAVKPAPDCDALVRFCEDIVRAPALVRVEWRGRVEFGYLASFEQDEGQLCEYECTLMFQPAQGEPYESIVPPWRAPRPRTLLENIEQGFEAGIATAEVAVTFARGTVDDAYQAVADVRGTLSRLRTVVDSADLVARDSVALQRATGEMLNELGATSRNAIFALGVPFATLAGADDAAAQLRARSWRNKQASAHRLNVKTAALARAPYRPETDVLGYHSGVEGETIWSVAWTWYGDARYVDTGAEAIRRRNRLASTSIRPGARLAIPRRAS